MYKGKHYKTGYKKYSVKKRVLLISVSLLLVMMMSVTATVSWIEDVSQVEFSSTDGQETPLHIGSSILYADARMKKTDSPTAVNLNDYFKGSGDMHLSPCYGDGENFYFPQEGNTSSFRVGTKDDANVNYLSVTFRVISEGAATAYWFEKTNNTSYFTFKKGSNKNAALEKYMRCSITVDGATNVYAIDDAGTADFQKDYKTVENNAVSTKTGRSVEEFSYYAESFNNDNSSDTATNAKCANQGTGNNLNGNVLFTVNKFDEINKASTIKTVTLKIWLEYGAYDGSAAAAGVDLADINLNIVSGWDKTRRIYVKDETVDEIDNGSSTGAHWLTQQNTPTLHWALASNVNTHFEKNGNVNNYIQYFDVPAVYNNVAVYLSRCDNGWNNGNSNKNGITCWDQYATTFPNTFHSETFTVYTKKFGTWNEYANNVYFVNSCNTTAGFDNRIPRAYMWDSSSEHGSGINDKVVKNANWTGIELTKLTDKVTGKNLDMDLYTFYYNSVYDRIIFNDDFGNQADRFQYQTQDLWLSGNDLTSTGQMKKPYFDMSTLSWYTSIDDLPKYSNVFLKSNMRGGNYDMETRFVYDKNGSGSVKYCYVYIKSDKTNDNHNHYTFTIWDGDTSTEYKCHKDSGNLALGSTYNLGTGGDFNKSFSLYDIHRGVYKITYNVGQNIKVDCIEDFQPNI